MSIAYRAQTIMTLAGECPARGLAALDAPVRVLRDGVLLVVDGVIEAVEPYAAFRRRNPPGCRFVDLGARCLSPALVNAHCHLELSHLAGRVKRGEGFAAWMRSLLPELGRRYDEAVCRRAIGTALCSLRESGTGHIGDVGSRTPAWVAEEAEALENSFGSAYPVTHFLEVMGFHRSRDGSAVAMPASLDAAGLTPACAAELPEKRSADCAVSGHALYSTGPEALRAVFAWCAAHERPFSLHLAESAEEEDCLLHGAGALHDLLAVRVLPPEWTAAGKRPVAYADTLGLLAPRTLAVHAVHCNTDDIALLARRGTSVCLCPRSNSYIGVGIAPARRMAEAGIALCIGTDSLASNQSLDMREELRAARALHDFSFPAVLRQATCNGAHALGLRHLGTLEPGKAACFALFDMSDDILR